MKHIGYRFKNRNRGSLMKEIRCRWCDGYMALFAESQNKNSKMFVCTTDDCQTDVAITNAGMNWRHVETNKGVIINITEPVDKR